MSISYYDLCNKQFDRQTNRQTDLSLSFFSKKNQPKVKFDFEI